MALLFITEPHSALEHNSFLIQPCHSSIPKLLFLTSSTRPTTPLLWLLGDFFPRVPFLPQSSGPGDLHAVPTRFLCAALPLWWACALGPCVLSGLLLLLLQYMLLTTKKCYIDFSFVFDLKNTFTLQLTFSLAGYRNLLKSISSAFWRCGFTVFSFQHWWEVCSFLISVLCVGSGPTELIGAGFVPCVLQCPKMVLVLITVGVGGKHVVAPSGWGLMFHIIPRSFSSNFVSSLSWTHLFGGLISWADALISWSFLLLLVSLMFVLLLGNCFPSSSNSPINRFISIILFVFQKFF